MANENDVDIGLEISKTLFRDLQQVQSELQSISALVDRIGGTKGGAGAAFQKMKQESKELTRQLQALKNAMSQVGDGQGLNYNQAFARRAGYHQLSMTQGERFKFRHSQSPLTTSQIQSMSMAELTHTKKLVGQLVSEALAKGDKAMAEAHRKVGQQMAEQLKSMQTVMQKQTALQQGNLAGFNRMNARDYKDRQLNDLLSRALDQRTGSGGIAPNSRGKVASLDAALAAPPAERKRILEAQKQLFDSALVDALKIPKSVQDEARTFHAKLERAFQIADKAGKDFERRQRYTREGRTSSITQDFKDAELRRQARSRQTLQGLNGFRDLDEAKERIRRQEFRAGRALNDYQRLQTPELKEQLALEAKALEQLKDWVDQTKRAQQASKDRLKAHKEELRERAKLQQEEDRLNQAEYGGTLYRRNQKQRYFEQTQTDRGLNSFNDLGEAKRRLEGQKARVGSAEVRLERETTEQNRKQLEIEREALRALETRIARLKDLEQAEKRRLKSLEKAQAEEQAWTRKNDPTYMQRNADYQRRATNERLFGDGGANLIGIQASLMAHYALLSGVQNLFSGSANFILELDRGLRQLQSIVRVTDNDMAGLSQRLIDISEITKFTALEVVQAATVLGQAGFGKRQIEEAMESVTLFATAVGTDLNTAVDLATSALGVFNKDADQMSVMVNQMTTAVNTSKLNLDKLTLGLQYAGNTAHQSNVPFEEVVATLGAMANSGIKSGSTLGTGLRQILITLQKPSAEFKQQMKDLGITMDELDLETHGLVGVMTTLAEKGFTVTDAMKTMEVRAAAAYGAFANNLDVARDMMVNLDDHTAAAKANETQMKALANQLDRLRSASLSMVNEGARPTLSVLTQMVTKMADAAGAAQNFGNALAFVGTAATLLVGGGLLGWLGRLGGGLLRGNPLLRASQQVAGSRGRGNLLLGGATLAASTGGAYYYQQMEKERALSDRIDKTQTEVDAFASESDRLQGYSERISKALEDIWHKRHQLEDDAAFQAMIRRMQTEFEKVGLVLDSSVVDVEGLIDKLKDLKISLDDEYKLKIVLEQTALEEARQAHLDQLQATTRKALASRDSRQQIRDQFQAEQDKFFAFPEQIAEMEKLRGTNNYQAPTRPVNTDSFGYWQDQNPEQEQVRQQAWKVIEQVAKAYDSSVAMSEEERSRLKQDSTAQLGPLQAQIDTIYQSLMKNEAGDQVLGEFQALREQLIETRGTVSSINRLSQDQDRTQQERVNFDWLKEVAPQFRPEASSLRDDVVEIQRGLQRGDFSDDPLRRYREVTPQLTALQERLDNLLSDIRELDPSRANLLTQELGTESLMGDITTALRELREEAEKPRQRILHNQLTQEKDYSRAVDIQFENANNLEDLDRLRAELEASERQRIETQTQIRTLKAAPGSIEAQRITADMQMMLDERLAEIDREYRVARDVITGNIDYSLAGTGAEFDEKLAGLVQNKVLYPFQRSLEAMDSAAKQASQQARRQAEDAADRRQALTDTVGVEGLSREERGALFDQALQAMAEETQYSRQALLELKKGNETQLARLTERLTQMRVDQEQAGEFTRTGQVLGKAIERAEAEQVKLQAELEKNTRELQQNTRSTSQQTQQLRRMRNLDQYRGSNYQSAAYRQRRAEFGVSGIDGIGDHQYHDSQGEVRTASRGGWEAMFDNVAQAYEGIDALTEVSLKAEEIMGGLADNMANMWLQVAQGAISAEDAMKNMIMNVAAQLVQSQIAGLLGKLISYAASAAAGYFGGGSGFGSGDSMAGSPNIDYSTGVAWQGGEVKGFYGGGVITSGREDRDSTYIKAAKGEFIVRREAVKAIGLDTLHELNRLDRSTVRSKAAAARAGRREPAPAKDSGIDQVNVYVVSKESVPNNLGPNDVVAIISDDLARGGKTKKLIQQINARHI
ncbi:phage tail tape measure protein [Oceanimonas pelagia]|uniref:Phage tail tape measure protein n=1 Tax=Oceanimonas pelagia TaxID=3028314 RepID=A0AA50Q6L2_9GAMM|nr:phage tail tape measure protein [Oceanimonas pelagia]WMC09505.1 phage tail tape measure protein [Oceanimonas pelagia]